MRVTRESVNIRIAQIIAERGTCNRLKVGAVITYQNKIIATGYNGTEKNSEHCNPSMCNTTEPCTHAIHAERNAIRNSKLLGGRTVTPKPDLVIYCTHQPCFSCAALIASYGISKVYYIHPYRDDSGLHYLKHKNIKVIQLDEQGNPKSV